MVTGGHFLIKRENVFRVGKKVPVTGIFKKKALMGLLWTDAFDGLDHVGKVFIFFCLDVSTINYLPDMRKICKCQIM